MIDHFKEINSTDFEEVSQKPIIKFNDIKEEHSYFWKHNCLNSLSFESICPFWFISDMQRNHKSQKSNYMLDEKYKPKNSEINTDHPFFY